MTTAPVPHRLVTTLLALVVPLALLGGSLALVASWTDELPDQVVTHWGPDGPDAWGSLGEYVLLFVVIGAALAVGAWALGFFLGREAVTRRLAAGFATGMCAMFALMMVGSLALQRGLTDAADAPGVGGVVGLSLAVGAALAAGAALLVPADAHRPTTAPVPADAPRVRLAPGERAVWTRTVSSRAATVVAGGALVLVGGLAFMLRSGGLALDVLLLLVVLGLTVLLFRFRVTVDESGLTSRSVLGWPRLTVPLDEVVEARAVQVRALSDFGGWGYRLGADGRVGIVLRTGEAIEVDRTGGRRAVVTVDDAAAAAALLNALADRRRVA